MSNQALQTEQRSSRMGAWFASLSAYNSGSLVGGWVYPLEHDSFESFYQAIKRVTRGHDEVAIHDYDNCPDMGEFPNHVDLYELIHAMEDSYLDNEALIKYMSNQHDYSADLVQDAEEAYITTADSFKDYAYEYAEEDIRNTVNAEAVQFVFNNFDYDGYASDLEHDYTVIELDNYDVAIFSNC
ncbi:antirestriction protein ArdA [Candidatus Pelagibacter sp.]|nr:antirestriction protein ArdA [Candidatus Pelagibacter sp.]